MAGERVNDLGWAVSVVGSSLRSARKRLGFSVQGLAERAGVSFGLISELERGTGNPSLQTLQRLAGALGVSIGQLLDEPSSVLAVVLADHRYVLPSPEDEPESLHVTRELLTPRGESMIQMIRSTLPSGFSNEGRPFRHIGTESVTVVSGVLIVVQGGHQVTIKSGDTVTYGCSSPHWWANGASGPTVVLGAVTPFER